MTDHHSLDPNKTLVTLGAKLSIPSGLGRTVY